MQPHCNATAPGTIPRNTGVSNSKFPVRWKPHSVVGVAERFTIKAIQHTWQVVYTSIQSVLNAARQHIDLSSSYAGLSLTASQMHVRVRTHQVQDCDSYVEFAKMHRFLIRLALRHRALRVIKKFSVSDFCTADWNSCKSDRRRSSSRCARLCCAAVHRRCMAAAGMIGSMVGRASRRSYWKSIFASLCYQTTWPQPWGDQVARNQSQSVCERSQGRLHDTTV